jgi:hypothetical protein
MSPARALAAPFAALALRRAVPIWIGVRLVSVAVLALGGALHRLWSPDTALWILVMGGLLLAARERIEWREGVLLGNLGVPRATLTALAGTMLLLLEALAQLVAARVLA